MQYAYILIIPSIIQSHHYYLSLFLLLLYILLCPLSYIYIHLETRKKERKKSPVHSNRQTVLSLFFLVLCGIISFFPLFPLSLFLFSHLFYFSPLSLFLTKANIPFLVFKSCFFPFVILYSSPSLYNIPSPLHIYIYRYTTLKYIALYVRERER